MTPNYRPQAQCFASNLNTHVLPSLGTRYAVLLFVSKHTDRLAICRCRARPVEHVLCGCLGPVKHDGVVIVVPASSSNESDSFMLVLALMLDASVVFLHRPNAVDAMHKHRVNPMPCLGISRRIDISRPKSISPNR